MDTPMASWHADFLLEDWHVSPKLNRISRDGHSVSVKHKSMAVLVFLADAEGEVLTRNEIMDGVWPGMEVTDDVLTQAIHELRHAFDDDAKHPRIIETIPRVGIRLLAAASVADEEPLAGETVSVEQPSQRYWLVAIAVIVVGAVMWAILDRQITVRNPVITVRDSGSIAVLPFVNRSSVAEDAFFVNGMPDDLRTLLSKVSFVETVTSRTSTERYRDTTKPIPQIGRELGVAAILEGAVQRSGNQIRINVQLIDTETEKDLWAETYNRNLTVENLFAIQSEITREIVAALHGVLTEQEDNALEVMPTNDLDAYAEFVLGRQELAKRTSDSISRAKSHFEKATELDADYALAWVSLADAYMLMAEFQGVPLQDIIAPTQAAIDKALSIDPLLGEAYTSLAGLRQYQLQHDESEKYYLRSIELSPGYARAYHWYYTLLLGAGRDDEAMAQLIRAIELDPWASVLTDNLAGMYLVRDQYNEARSTLFAGLERDPDFPGFYRTGTWLLMDEGRPGEALKWAQIASSLDPSNPNYNRTECDLYLDLGDDQSATVCIAAMIDAYPESKYNEISWLHYYQMEFEEALDALRLWERETPRNQKPLLRSLAGLYSLFGDSGSARSILEEIDPHLFGESDVAVTPLDIISTAAAAYAMYVDGETDRANYLFDQVLDAICQTGRDGFYLDVLIHVVRGNGDLAVRALRDAVDSGMRTSWWQLRFPLYASMQDNPEWLELIAEIEADIRQQRQWYEEHKDDPLF